MSLNEFFLTNVCPSLPAMDKKPENPTDVDLAFNDSTGHRFWLNSIQCEMRDWITKYSGFNGGKQLSIVTCPTGLGKTTGALFTIASMMVLILFTRLRLSVTIAPYFSR